MAKLVYDGNSQYGVAVRLANRRSLVNITAEMPFELGDNLTEEEVKYYKSLRGCNLKLVGELKVKEVPPVEEVVDEVEEVVEESVEVVEEIDKEEEVVEKPTAEDVYYDLVEKLSDDEIKELCNKVGFTSKKRNASKKLWDLLCSDKFDEVLDLL